MHMKEARVFIAEDRSDVGKILLDILTTAGHVPMWRSDFDQVMEFLQTLPDYEVEPESSISFLGTRWEFRN